VIWSADLDGDGSPEWVLESQKVRAVFSAQDGGRWIDFTATDAAVDFLSDQGAFASTEAVEVSAGNDALVFTSARWKRTARLSGDTLTIEQSTSLPPMAWFPASAEA